MKVDLSARAERDLRLVLTDLARENANAAIALDERFAERFDQLSRRPLIGRPRPDMMEGARGILVGSHVVFYSITSDAIAILRILHGSRDLPSAALEDT